MKLIDEDDERFKGLGPAVKSQLIYMNEAMGKLVNELNQLKSVDIANNKWDWTYGAKWKRDWFIEDRSRKIGNWERWGNRGVERKKQT